jgi:FKBP-type peptidyl-prolyl cis-trans isomerase FkpA
MNRGLRVIRGFLAVIPLIVASCMMRDSEDFPDFNEQLQKDIASIDSYLDANNLTAVEHSSGIRYIINVDSANTNKATIDSCISVNYEGKLMVGGQTFDEDEAVAFPLSALIDGWKIAIPLLDRGDSATLYIPSGWGYGFVASDEIPANSNLIFHVRLIDVGSNYKASDRSCD